MDNNIKADIYKIDNNTNKKNTIIINNMCNNNYQKHIQPKLRIILKVSKDICIL